MIILLIKGLVTLLNAKDHHGTGLTVYMLLEELVFKGNNLLWLTRNERE